MNNDFRISPLRSKDNYASWLIDIRAILRIKNYWNSSLSNGDAEVDTTAALQIQQAKQAYANTTIIKTETTTTAPSAAPPNHAAIKRRVRREWQTASEKAADIITLTLHADVKAKLLM